MTDKRRPSLGRVLKQRFVKDSESGLVLPPATVVERAQERAFRAARVVGGSKTVVGRYKTPGGLWRRRKPMSRMHGRFSPGLVKPKRLSPQQKNRRAEKARRRARAVNRGR